MMGLSPKILKLKAALEAHGVVAAGNQDDILDMAIAVVIRLARKPEETKPVESLDAHSSGPQFDVPKKRAVKKKKQ
jgi:hypothetical protein